MSWYDSNYRRRTAISVPNTAGSATADVDVTIPEDWDEFWDTIDTAGANLRLTGPDGRTLLTYDVDKPGGGAFSKSGRSGRIRIDGAALVGTANYTSLLWLYWDPEDTVTDGSSAVTISGALDGYLELGRPTRRAVVVQPHPPGLDRPQTLDSKSSTAAEHYWADVAAILEVYRRPVEERLCYEEIAGVLVASLDDTGAAAALHSHTDTRFVEVDQGRGRRMLIRLKLSGGTNGERYTAGLVISTRTPASSSAHRTITHRFGLAVVDALEPAT